MILRLREILKEKGLTISQLSEISGISQSNLSNYMIGKISPTLDTIKKIAESLNINIGELFKEPEELELYVKSNGKFYQITKHDIIEIIINKNGHE